MTKHYRPSTYQAKAIDPEDGSLYRWYVLAVLVLINAMGAADKAIISVVAEPLKQEFSLSDKDIGLLGGVAYTLPYALAILPMGWLVDRLNRRALLCFSVTIWSGLTAAGSIAANFTLLAIARMGVGTAEATQGPAAMSLMADTFPPDRRSTAIGIYIAGAAAGAILIFVAGAWLLAHYGWRTVFLVSGGPGVALAALLLFTTKEPRRGRFDTPSAAPDNAGFKATFKSIIGNKAIVYTMAGATIANGVIFSITIWTTSFLVRVYDKPVSEGAFWTGMGYGLGMVIGATAVGPIADRFAKGQVKRLALIPILASIVAVIAGMVMTSGHSLGVSLIGLCLIAVMGGMFVPPGYAIIIALSPARERGISLAASRFVTNLLGNSTIPLMTGAISDALDIRWAILFTSTLLIFTAFFYWRVSVIAQRE